MLINNKGLLLFLLTFCMTNILDECFGKRTTGNTFGGRYNPEEEPLSCPPNTYTCGTGECIHQMYKCDGDSDCSDGSDEKGCGTIKGKPHSQHVPPGSGQSSGGGRRVRDDFVCPNNLYTCKNKECTIATARCDGTRHCTDGSDEEDCPDGNSYTPPPGQQRRKVDRNFKCPHGLFTCDNKECVVPAVVCDGKGDCSDDSDEWNCQSTPKDKPGRTKQQKDLDDMKKLKKDAKKRGSQQKKSKGSKSRTSSSRTSAGGKDEEHGACGPNLFECRSKECILPKYRCDGDKDCYDGSDEVGCGRPGEEESPSEGQSGTGSQEGQRNTGGQRSTGGQRTSPEEEFEETPSGCTHNLYECGSKECILPKYVCDGEKDCYDGSDEVNCVGGRQTEKRGQKTRSQKTQNQKSKSQSQDKKKSSNKKKTEKTKKKKKEENGAKKEEKNEGSKKKKEKLPDDFRCPNNLFTCSNRECVPQNTRCNMRKDCSDGSDEWGCQTFFKGTAGKQEENGAGNSGGSQSSDSNTKSSEKDEL